VGIGAGGGALGGQGGGPARRITANGPRWTQPRRGRRWCGGADPGGSGSGPKNSPHRWRERCLGGENSNLFNVGAGRIILRWRGTKRGVHNTPGGGTVLRWWACTETNTGACGLLVKSTNITKGRRWPGQGPAVAGEGERSTRVSGWAEGFEKAKRR